MTLANAAGTWWFQVAETEEGYQMVIRKSLAGLAVASLVLGSTVAAAAPVAAARTGSKVSVAERNVGGGDGVDTFTLLLGLLIAGGIAGIVLAKKSNNSPTSP